MLEYVRASDATEVQIEADGLRLRLLRRPGLRPLADPAAVQAGYEAPANGSPLAAPLTGVFYRAPSPTAPPYVEVGDRVEPGTVVGLIETMKIYNEVLAERRGRISAILAEPGQLVHAGDTLMMIDEAAEPGGEQAQS